MLHAVWFWPVVWGAWGVVLVLGFALPARFGAGASIKLANSERGVGQARALALADCTGARGGWYRDAEVGVHAGGEVSGKLGGAAVVLRARRRGGAVVVGRIELQDRRTRSWAVVPDAATRGHEPSRGAVYRAAGTFFTVDAG